MARRIGGYAQIDAITRAQRLREQADGEAVRALRATEAAKIIHIGNILWALREQNEALKEVEAIARATKEERAA